MKLAGRTFDQRHSREGTKLFFKRITKLLIFNISIPRSHEQTRDRTGKITLECYLRIHPSFNLLKRPISFETSLFPYILISRLPVLPITVEKSRETWHVVNHKHRPSQSRRNTKTKSCRRCVYITNTDEWSCGMLPSIPIIISPVPLLRPYSRSLAISFHPLTGLIV